MIKNYIITTLRSIKNQKLFSFLNILGLAIGLSASLVIMLWVQDELQRDNSFKDQSLLYRVYERQQYSGGAPFLTYNTPGPLADELKMRFPEITKATRFSGTHTTVIFNYEDKVFEESQGYFADQDAVDMFDMEVLQGNEKDLLTRPRSIVLTESLTQKYFGDFWKSQEILGKSIVLNNQWSYQITGIVKDPPAHTSFSYEYLIPFVAIEDVWGWKDGYMDWGNNYTATYLKLTDSESADVLDSNVRGLIKERLEGAVIDLYLNPLSKVYLYDLNGEGGRIVYVRIFTGIAFLVLFIACINFMNMSTAKAGVRSKEVGIRKSIGATRQQLIAQFLGESVLLALLSLVVSIGIVYLVLPYFNEITSKSIYLDFTRLDLWVSLTAIVLATGLLAGSYPAFYMSAFRPFDAFKGIVKAKGALVRKVLVITQFSLSILLILGSVVIYQQLDFMQQKKLGYVKENVIFFPIKEDFEQRFKILKDQMLTLPEVRQMTATESIPVGMHNSTSQITWTGKDPNATLQAHFIQVDYDFLETLGMELVEGRDFSPELRGNVPNYIVNEAMIDLMGEEGYAGASFSMWREKGNIVGVVKNFNFKSLAHQIEPLVLKLEPTRTRTVMVRLSNAQMQNTLAKLESIWEKVCPGLPFNYRFLDETYGSLYRAEQTISTLTAWFAALAVIVSCLGLLGLAAFMAGQMRKEVGIRKVVGASVISIVWLFSKAFVKWIIVSNLIALPLAYMIMTDWLQNYTYRKSIGIDLMAGTFAFSLLLALLTVLYQSLKTAHTNPAEVLASE